MAYAPDILTSLHGRLLGLGRLGELILGKRDAVVSAVAYANTAASTAVTNTTTETAFSTSYSVPANSVRPGSRIKLRYQGIATATNGTDTLLIKAYIGSTAVLTGTATDVANNAIFAGEWTGIIRTVGASGTIVGYGTHTKVPAASGTAAPDIADVLASATIDTTAAQVISVKATWSAASASNSARLDVLAVEIA